MILNWESDKEIKKRDSVNNDGVSFFCDYIDLISVPKRLMVSM